MEEVGTTNADELEVNEDGDDDDDDEDESSLYTRATRMVHSLVGGGSTDSAPMRTCKKRKMLKRRFTLLHIKSTTPSELFERKLRAEEYGEALHLASAYNLDADLVYQKQWRSLPITDASIRDYLSKIKKRSWILHE